MPLQRGKRKIDVASATNSLSTKRARLTRTDTQDSTGLLRRSARIQTQQGFRGKEGPRIATSVPAPPPSGALFEVDTGRGQLASKRAGRPPSNTRQPRHPHRNLEQTGKGEPSKLHYTSVLEAQVEEQRQLCAATRLPNRDTDNSGDYNEHQPKQAPLTRKNLALFNKMGGKRQGTNTQSTAESKTTKTTSSTTSSGFAMQAYKNGILQPLSSKPPANIADILEQHTRTRTSAAPTEPEYKSYANRVGRARNEATMVVEVSGKLLKEYDEESYSRVFNQAFTGFPKDVGFNNGLSAPQPDFVEGLEMQEHDPFPIYKYLNGAVLYKDDPLSLTLPHLAGEWKGPDGKMKGATLQSGYDGAALVYARNEALAFIGKPDPPGHAEVRTFTTDGTNINFYTHYAAPSSDGTLKYHQYQYASANIKDTHQGHNDGRRGLRNEQQHAREQSYALRERLKEHWKQRCDALQSIAEGSPPPIPDIEPPAATNICEHEIEDEAGYGVVEQPHRHTLQASPGRECSPEQGKPTSSRSSSAESPPPASEYRSGSRVQKRKALLSEGPSRGSSRQKTKGEDDSEQNVGSGRYCDEH